MNDARKIERLNQIDGYAGHAGFLAAELGKLAEQIQLVRPVDRRTLAAAIASARACADQCALLAERMRGSA